MRKLLIIASSFFFSTVFSTTTFSMTCEDIFRTDLEPARSADVRAVIAAYKFEGDPVAIRHSTDGGFVGVLGQYDMYVLKVNDSEPHLTVSTTVKNVVDDIRFHLSEIQNASVTLSEIAPSNTGEELVVYFRYEKEGRTVNDSFKFRFGDL